MDLCKKTEDPNHERKPVVCYFSNVTTESMHGRISPTPDNPFPAMSEDTMLDTILYTHRGSLQDTLLAQAQQKVKEQMEGLQLGDLHKMSGSLDKDLQSYTERFHHIESRSDGPGRFMYDAEMYTEYESLGLDLNKKYMADNKAYKVVPMVREKKSVLHLDELVSSKTEVKKENTLQPPFKLTGFETLIKLWDLDNWRLNC